jgi:hypothetical protein
MVVAFLGTAAIGAGIGLLGGYALGRLHHRGEGPPKPLPVRVSIGTKVQLESWPNVARTEGIRSRES